MVQNQRRGQQRGNNPRQQKGKQQGQTSQGKHTSGLNLTELANSGISEGISAFIETHPRFTEQEQFLASYIDSKNMHKYLAQSITDVKKQYGNKVDAEKVKDTLAGYVNSGEVFTNKGKEVLLSHSWDTKSRRWWASEAKEVMKGEQYLDKTLAAFRELYSLVKSGDYEKHNPKLTKAVEGVYRLGFSDAALNVLYENGQLDKSKYVTLKRAIVDRAKQGEDYVIKEVERSAIHEKVEKVKKVAAAAIAGIGAAVVLGTNSITGNAIGSITGNVIKMTETSLTPLLVGVGMIVAGILLGFRKK